MANWNPIYVGGKRRLNLDTQSGLVGDIIFAISVVKDRESLDYFSVEQGSPSADS